MSYFVTGATGFIGRYLVQELLDNHEGEVFVLVRGGSQPRMQRLIHQWGHGDRVTDGQGRPRRRRARRRPGVGRGAPRVDRPLRAPGRDLRHDRLRRAERDPQRRRHAQRHRARRRPGRGLLPPGVLDRRLRRLPGFLGRDDVRRRPAAAVAVPPDEVRVRADRARGVVGAVAGLPPVDGHRPLRDRRDGQGGRPLLLLPHPQAAARLPAHVDPAGRRRPGRHERRACRLRRLRDGPPDAPRGARRGGLPPGQPRAAAHGRRHQPVRRGRQGSAVRDADRP